TGQDVARRAERRYELRDHRARAGAVFRQRCAGWRTHGSGIRGGLAGAVAQAPRRGRRGRRAETREGTGRRRARISTGFDFRAGLADRPAMDRGPAVRRRTGDSAQAAGGHRRPGPGRGAQIPGGRQPHHRRARSAAGRSEPRTPSARCPKMNVASAASQALVGCGALIIAAQAGAALPIESWRTPAGAKVLFVEAHQLPILDVAVDFPAGSSRDPAGKPGLANLTLQLTRMGAGQMDENEISRRFADVGAQLSQRFDVDRAGFSLRTLSSPAEMTQALDVFAAVVQAPTFPAAVLEREKARIAAALREAQTRPANVVEKTFLRLAYGTHPYGQLGAGEPETVAAITREDVVGFRQAYYSSDHAVVAIIGDVTREQAQRISARLTVELPRADRPLPSLPPVAHPQEPAS